MSDHGKHGFTPPNQRLRRAINSAREEKRRELRRQFDDYVQGRGLTFVVAFGLALDFLVKAGALALLLLIFHWLIS